MPATSLIVTGTGFYVSDNDYWIQDKIHDTFGWTTSSRIDDYVQYLPSTVILTSIAANERTRQDHGWQYLISTASTAALTHGMKRIINRRRPNGGYYSFPSGHTSFMFSTSTVLYHMIRERSPGLAYLAYLPAVTVAGYRVVRDRHYLSDVIFGAGLGILTTQLTYHWMPSNRSHDASSAGHWQIGPTADGIGLTYRW